MHPLKHPALLPHTAPLRKKQSTVFPTVQLYFSHKINRRSKKLLDGIHTCIPWFLKQTGSAAAEPPIAYAAPPPFLTFSRPNRQNENFSFHRVFAPFYPVFVPFARLCQFQINLY